MFVLPQTQLSIRQALGTGQLTEKITGRAFEEFEITMNYSHAGGSGLLPLTLLKKPGGYFALQLPPERAMPDFSAQPDVTQGIAIDGGLANTYLTTGVNIITLQTKTKIAGALVTTGDTTFTLDDVTDLAVGDILLISEDDTSELITIDAIDDITLTVTLAVRLDHTYTVVAEISSLENSTTTLTLNADASASDARIILDLSDPADVTISDVIRMNNGTDEELVLITAMPEIVTLTATIAIQGKAPFDVAQIISTTDLALTDTNSRIGGMPVTYRRIIGAPFDFSSQVTPRTVALRGIILRDHDPANPISNVNISTTPAAPDGSVTSNADGIFFIPALPVAETITLDLDEGETPTSVPFRPDFARPVNTLTLSLATPSS